MRKLIINTAEILSLLGLIIAILIAYWLGHGIGGHQFGLLYAFGALFFGALSIAGFLCLVEIAENSAKTVQLLREQQETQPKELDQRMIGKQQKYRGYDYALLDGGEASLKLSSGEWRMFPSIEDLKIYVDVVGGKAKG